MGRCLKEDKFYRSSMEGDLSALIGLRRRRSLSFLYTGSLGTENDPPRLFSSAYLEDMYLLDDWIMHRRVEAHATMRILEMDINQLVYHRLVWVQVHTNWFWLVSFSDEVYQDQ